MAGMEQLEIHSKSYLVRWVDVAAGNTISWSLQPHKKSISFGIFKHPGAANASTPNLTPQANFGLQPPSMGPPHEQTEPKGRRSSSIVETSVSEKFQKLGLKSVAWAGKCEADRVSMGKYDVPEGDGGMYGLVFDNTHAKQLSKTVTFVLMTYPTNSPPKSGHHLHYSQAMARKSSTSFEKGSPNILPTSDSNESLPQDSSRMVLEDPRPRSSQAQESKTSLGSTFYTGVLSKKRRKRNQGYARRFFSLDFTSNTLSYYKNRHTSALRGSVPLSLAAIGVNERSRHISVDSGAEIWHLRAHGKRDFNGWREALERAAQTASTNMTPVRGDTKFQAPKVGDTLGDDREWGRVEALVGRTSGIRDALRRLAQDTDPKYSPRLAGLGIKHPSPSPSPVEQSGADYFTSKSLERPSFWKRKISSSAHSPYSGAHLSNASGNKDSLAPPTSPPISIPKRGNKSVSTQHGDGAGHVHDHCMALLRDLDAVVSEFSSLVADNRQRRTQTRPSAISRQSFESSVYQEFYDAEDGIRSPTQVIDLGLTSDADEEGESLERDVDTQSIGADSTSTGASSVEDLGTVSKERHSSLLPDAPKSLTPLPHPSVSRRKTIPPASGSPPSLISFLRKNVGKDLSTIAMPVTANEPLSLLQRQSEELTSSHLLDTAASFPIEVSHDNVRLLYLATFAISGLASSRARERATRKPFNPMLGETFELVREDLGFRFLAEKISHHPVRIACQAESAHWTYLQSPAPSQKFWGKSAELTTDGRARIVLHTADGANRCISWAPATCFLRNILAGEKYMEPVGSMTLVDETSRARATVTFKAGGMFSGRSEDVTVAVYDAQGSLLPLGLAGKWTTSLSVTSASSSTSAAHDLPGSELVDKEIWSAPPLLPSPAAHYGMTAFAATLNQVTELERDALPPTDSRRRPDQRAYEEGKVDEAESLKIKLEEAQRRRRKEMGGEAVWVPRWFERADEAAAGGGEAEGGDGAIWRLKDRDGYWDVREAVVGFKGGKWDGVREVFEV